MAPIKHVIRGLVVVSAAAGLAVLITAHPAVPLSALSASSFYGSQSDGSNCLYSCGSASPSLQISPNEVAPGQTITVSGTGFGQCTLRSGEILVRLIIGDRTITEKGIGGTFGPVGLQAPSAAGSYNVVAVCLYPSGDTSPPVAQIPLTVTGGQPPGSNGPLNGRPSSRSNGRPPNSEPLGPNIETGFPVGPVGGSVAVLLLLLLLLALVSRRRRVRRDIRWVRERLRAVANPAPGLPTTEIRHRPGGRSVSLAFEPHLPGDQN
jgi:hypothetical protein